MFTFPFTLYEKVTQLVGLLGHWKLDDLSGDAIDSSTLAPHDGTVSGATQNFAGIYQNGRAYDFDGVNDIVTTA